MGKDIEFLQIEVETRPISLRTLLRGIPVRNSPYHLASFLKTGFIWRVKSSPIRAWGNFHRNPAEAPACKQAEADLSGSWCPKGEPEGSGQLLMQLSHLDCPLPCFGIVSWL
ncbi:hypothetical protein SAMN05216417_1247 [Nitrosospira multiformis]|uniref:Uncharacterized protein n=1 Tax=Nitrosospira multiformis TaxID=1231 RepID=A0A1I7IQZ1_9PROT|nr:hypothetical protein SAMN05216417_1247 [Nitrosospira multiformis]